MEDKKLELRLGPPGDDVNFYANNGGVKRGLQANTLADEAAKRGERKWMPNSNSDNKSTLVLPNTSEKRVAEAAPVVGWPPVRSFRKNLGMGSSSKAAARGSPNKLSKGSSEVEKKLENKGLFVKINMDGVPIGRKIDLGAYQSYDTLSLAVDQLFRGLLAAQKNHIAKSHQQSEKEEEPNGNRGSLGVSGEYTLVYEDNEGDRMLVGDVPWQMFVSTAKRLRVLKRSELSSLQVSSNILQKGGLLPLSGSKFENK